MAWDDFPSVEVLESAEPDTRESQWGSFPDATDEYRSIQRAAPLFDEQSRRDLMDSEPDAWSLPGKTREQQQFKLQRLLQEDVSRRADDPKYDDLVEDRRAQRRLLGRMPFVGAASEVPRLLRVRDASERLNNGKATEQDLLDIQEFVSESRDRQQEHEDSPIASQVKETLAALPGFVTEFVATGGLYAGAKKATEKTLTKLGRGAVEKGVVSRLAGVGAQSLANPQMIARSAAQTALDETLQGGDTSFLEALPSGLVDTLAELGSERSGGRVGDLAGKIPGVRALHGRIAAMWLRLNPDKGMTEFLRATATKAGWNGVLGEMGEERVGDLIRGSAGTAGLPGLDFGTVGDVSAGQRGLWWSGEQKDIDRGARGVRSLTAEGLSFGVPSAAGAALTAGPNVSNWLRGRGPLLTPPEPSGAVPDETVGDAPPVAGETPDLESQLLQFAEMAIPSRKLLDSPDVMQFIVDRMPQFERVRGLEPDVQMAEAARILKSSNNRRMAQSWLRRELKRMGVADSFNTGEGVIPDEEQEGQGGEVRQVADEPSVDDPAAGAEDGSVPAADRDYEAADAAVKAEYAGYSDRQLELASERLSSGEDERSKTVLGFVRAEQEKRKNSATNVGSQPPVVVEGGDSGSTGSSTPVVNAPEPVVKPGSIRVEPAATAPADQAPASVDGLTKVGTRQSMAGRGEQEAVEVVRGADGVDYELWKDVAGRGGVLRTVDVDSGKVVGITSGPSFSGLKGKFDESVKRAQKPATGLKSDEQAQRTGLKSDQQESPPKKQGSPSEKEQPSESPAKAEASSPAVDAKDVPASGGSSEEGGAEGGAVEAAAKPEPDDLEAMLRAAVAEEFGDAAAKVAGEASAASSVDKPKKQGSPKPKPLAGAIQTLSEAEAKVRALKDAAFQEFRDLAGDLGMNNALNPKLSVAAVKLMRRVVELGTVKFAKMVAESVSAIGESTTRKLAPYLERGWDILRERPEFSHLDKAQTVESVLGPEQKATVDDDGSGIRDESESGSDPVRGSGDGGAGSASTGLSPGVEDGSAGDVRSPEASGRVGDAGDGGGESVRQDLEGTDQRGDASVGREPGSGARADDGTGVTGRDGTDPNAGVQSATVERSNYHLTDPDAIVGGGPKAKFARNQKALDAYAAARQENRAPTPAELDLMAGYVGWGAFGQELFNSTWDRPNPKAGWENEDEWLRAHLGQEEWESARESIINAHYTDPVTAGTMWDMARRMGFTGGRVLEPAIGGGMFFSTMPRDLMANSQLTGIDLDVLSAGMSGMLHPGATVHQMGYEKSETPNGFYDLVISNVPFANLKPASRQYAKFDASLHNFYFLKAMDQVRPGGLVMFITSNMTMDGVEAAKIRRQLSKQGDLVGAWRMPSGAFQKYAGTKVVADLIVLRKRTEGEAAFVDDQDWLNLTEVMTPSGTKVRVNEYWASHPNRVLGTLDFGHGTTSGRPGMIVTKTADFETRLEKIVGQVPENIMLPAVMKNPDAIQTKDRHRFGTIVIDKDVPRVSQGEHLVPLSDLVKWQTKNLKQTAARRKGITRLAAVRDALAEVLDHQREGAVEKAAEARKRLNFLYDAFTSENGAINESSIVEYFKKANDPLANSLMALESKESDGSYSKRPIFVRATTRSKPRAEGVSVGDAYAFSRNEGTEVNLERVAELSKTPVDQVLTELTASGAIFKTANGIYEPADVFLSGNVRRKLRETKAAQAEKVPGLEKSIEALEAVVPESVPYTEVTVKLGAPWIEQNDYREFIGHLVNENPAVIQLDMTPRGWNLRNETPGAQNVWNKAEARQTWGTPQFSLQRIINHAMNNKTPKVYVADPTDPTGRARILSQPLTEEAIAKLEEVKEKFEDWIWSSPERIARLGEAYNDSLNPYATPKYDGSHLTFEGMMLERGEDPFSFRKHQADATWRNLVVGRALDAHEVGTGKTAVIVATAIEGKRLGKFKKTLLFADNANSIGVFKEAKEMYPGAKILYVENLSPSERDQTMSQIALDEWDLIVVPHSLVERFALRPETVEAQLGEMIEDLYDAALDAVHEDQRTATMAQLRDEDWMKRNGGRQAGSTAKDLVKEARRLEDEIEKARLLANNPKTVFFEDMGVDSVMIDEAHKFKKLPLSSAMNVKGLNKTASQRGTMMMMISDFIRGLNNGKGMFLFTGTPITNSLNEIYNMQRLLMAEEMKKAGVFRWDDWFNTFSDTGSDVELTPGGNYDTITRLTKFVNVPELRQMIGQYLDVVKADQMPEFVPRAEREGKSEKPVGRPHKQMQIETEVMTEAQREVQERMLVLYQEWQQADKKQRRAWMQSSDEHLPVRIDDTGKKNALDPRFLDPDPHHPVSDGDDPRLKVNRCVANVMRYYHEHPESTQMIFMQLGMSDYVERVVRQPDGTPVKDANGKSLKEQVPAFNLSKDIVRKLVAQGVKESEIAVINADIKKGKKDAIMQAMREGTIRVAIGTSESMGVGVNAQTHMRAMHHLDAPWTPADFEQRNGRGWRQGNKWNTVFEHRYITEGSNDGRRWQAMLTKLRFINEFFSGKTDRVIEGDALDLDDEGGGLGDFEQTLSAAAGDPRIILRAKLEKDVEKLEKGKRRHAVNQQKTAEGVQEATRDIATYQESATKFRQDAETWDANKEKPFEMDVLGVIYKDRDEAKAALVRAGMTYTGRTRDKQIGHYRGFDIHIRDAATVAIGPGGKAHGVLLSVASLDGTLRQLGNHSESWQRHADQKREYIAQADAVMSRPYSRLGDLEKRKAKLNYIIADMQAFPTPSPSWLRNGAPVNTNVWWNGDKQVVDGHRSRGDDHWVLLEPEGGSMTSVPIGELTDELGTPLFPDYHRDPSLYPSPKRIAPVSEWELEQERGNAALADREDRSNRGMPMSAGRNPVSGRRVKMEIPYRTKAPAGVVIPQTAAGKVIQSVVDAAESLGAEIPLRVGLFHGKNIRGIYKTVARVARVRAAGDIVGATHELGHGMWALLSSWNGTGIRPVLSGPIRRELMGIAKALYPNGAPSGGYVEEGFADFVRQWVTDPKEATRHAPKMVAWWEGHFLPAMPEFKAKIEAAREQAQNYRQQGAKALASTQLVDTSSLKRRASKAQQQAAGLFSNTSLWETLDPYRHVTAAAEELLGRKLSITEDPYRTGKTVRMTQHGIVKKFVKDGIRTTDGHFLAPALDDVGKSIDEKEAWDFKLYLFGKRALALWQDPNGPRDPGIPEPVAQELVDDVENDPARAARYQTASQVVYDWNEGVLDYVAEFSPLFSDSVAKIRARDPGYYVPLARDFDEIAGTIRSMGGSAARGNIVAKLRGSGLPVKDMIPQMIANATRMVGLGHQRMVLEQLAELAKIPGMGKVIEEVDVANIPAASRTIEDLVAEIEKRMAPGDSLGSEWQNVGDDVITFFAQAQRTPAGKPIIPMVVDEGGERKLKWFYVREDLYHGLSGLDFGSPELSGWGRVAWKTFTVPTKIAKAGYVGYRASFGLLTNPLADLPTFLVNSRADKNVVGVFGEWISQVGKSLLHVATGGKYTTPEIEFWERMGGGMASSLAEDQSETRAYARDVFGHTLTERLVSRSKWGAVLADFADFYRDFIQFSENAPRLAEISLLAKERGIDLSGPVPMNEAMELLLAGQEVTIDFREGGTMTRIANQVFPFLLAPFSGARAIGRAAQDHPMQFARRAALLGLAALALWWRNKDEDWWIEKDDQEKFRYYYVRIGNTIFKYPRRDIGLFTSITEGLADAAYRRDPSAMTGWMTSVLKGFAPSAPPILEEPAEQMLNKDLFTGMPIVGKSLEGKPAEEQHDEFTSRAAILLGSLFKQSPKRIDHAIRGIGGGVAADFVESAGLGAAGVDRDWEASDTFVLGRLFQRGGTMGSNPKTVREFYDKLGEFQQREKSDLHPLSAFEKQQDGMMEDARKALTTLSAARRVAKNGEQRDAITREMIGIAREAMDRVESGKLTDKRKSSLVYEATSSLKGVKDETVESRKEARAAVKASGLAVDAQLAALKAHWLADAQADEDKKAKLAGRKPKKVMRFNATDAYRDRQRLIRKGLE